MTRQKEAKKLKSQQRIKELEARLEALQSQNAQLQSRPDNTAKDKVLLKSQMDLVQDIANIMGCMPERDVLLKVIRKQKSDLKKAQDELSQARLHTSEPIVSEVIEADVAMVPVETITSVMEKSDIWRHLLLCRPLIERIERVVEHGNKAAEDLKQQLDARTDLRKLKQHLGLGPSATYQEMCTHIHWMRDRIDKLEASWNSVRKALELKDDVSVEQMITRAMVRQTFHHEVWAIAGMKPGHDHTLYSVLKSAMESDRQFKKMSDQVVKLDQRRIDLEEQLEDAADRVEAAFAMVGRALVTGG